MFRSVTWSFRSWDHSATWTGNLISVLVVIALTTVVAYISFRLIEVPMVAFGKLHEPLLRSSIKRVRAKLGLLNIKLDGARRVHGALLSSL